MKTLAMFPGQGSQYAGMGKELLDEFPLARLTYEEAEDTLKLKIKSLSLEGPDSELTLTANTQPCILTLSTAYFRVLKNESSFRPDFFAGHSLGEYSALVASEKISFADALKLVRKRGEAMQSAVPAGLGSMAAILNMDKEKLEALCKECSSAQHIVSIANYNSPQQIVVAGHTEAVSRVMEQAKAFKAIAKLLPVSAPFHSPLMKPAQDVMRPLLEQTTFLENKAEIIANTSGKIASPYKAAYLVNQITDSVKWSQTLEESEKLSCETYVEIGPGKVLWGLARRSLKQSPVKLLATEGDFVGLLKEFSH